MEQKTKSPAAAAPVLTDANSHIPITSQKEGPVKIADDGSIVKVNQIVAKNRTDEIVNPHLIFGTGHHLKDLVKMI